MEDLYIRQMVRRYVSILYFKIEGGVGSGEVQLLPQRQLPPVCDFTSGVGLWSAEHIGGGPLYPTDC